MNTTTTPAARFGWEGQTVEYVVTATGASEISVPEQREDGLTIRVLDTREVNDGIEARVAIDVDGPVLY